MGRRHRYFIEGSLPLFIMGEKDGYFPERRSEL